MGGEIKNVESGVYATGTGKLTINGEAKITFTRDYGVKVEGGATADITGATITGGGSGQGVIKDGAGEMTMTKVDISRVQTGIQVTSGNLTVSGGTMTGVEKGIDMSGSGRLTVNNNARITFTGDYGIGVGNGVTANITGAEIKGGGQGMGVGSKGVIMESSRTMMMTKGSISNVEKAVLMNGAGKLVMNNVQISGVKMGVEATKGNLTISGNSVITFKNGDRNYGVKVGREVTMASLTNVAIRGGGNGKGVYATGAKAVTLTKVDISNVSEGVLMKGGGTLTIKEGSIGFKGGADNYVG
ncbi:NosD domain-containing protein [Bartonella bovis]|uniref:NosD domain-containing protein n=1 Tax=Bartonella bovis TaxID=155194 RepID=UPI000C9C01BB|nr:NosD domain-containing protein [Bartonella bovis]